jgi:hypothetical protein
MQASRLKISELEDGRRNAACHFEKNGLHVGVPERMPPDHLDRAPLSA